jgi:hypothetical protein
MLTQINDNRKGQAGAAASGDCFAFEVGLDLFERFAFCLRQEEGRGDEIDHGESGEEEED